MVHGLPLYSRDVVLKDRRDWLCWNHFVGVQVRSARSMSSRAPCRALWLLADRRCRVQLRCPILFCFAISGASLTPLMHFESVQHVWWPRGLFFLPFFEFCVCVQIFGHLSNCGKKSNGSIIEWPLFEFTGIIGSISWNLPAFLKIIWELFKKLWTWRTFLISNYHNTSLSLLLCHCSLKNYCHFCKYRWYMCWLNDLR